MPTLLQINECANHSSHGKIAEKLGEKVMEHGWESYIAYGRYASPSKSHLIRIGSNWSVKWDAVQSRLFDNHGLASKAATIKFIEQVRRINPDIIHLHNLHGYYINYPILFQYLKDINVPVVWTLHDCWAMTGHCAHFELAKCFKWKEECHHCPIIRSYPASFFYDNSRRNYWEKKMFFSSLDNLTIVPVSHWLEAIVKESFLKNNRIKTIQNGIDLDIFYPRKNMDRKNDKFVILGVASVWYDTKGINEFIQLSEDDNYHIIMVGTDEKLENHLPSKIQCIRRTSNVQELVEIYSSADIFLNPTYNDTFPTVNIEAMACGTPVITYNTGGSPETLKGEGGWVVEKGNLDALKAAIEKYRHLSDAERHNQRQKCLDIVVNNYQESDCYDKYWALYQSLLH